MKTLKTKSILGNEKFTKGQLVFHKKTKQFGMIVSIWLRCADVMLLSGEQINGCDTFNDFKFVIIK